MSDNYGKLAGPLRDREGWRPEVQDDEEHWCFGVDGASRLVIVPEMGGVFVHIEEQNKHWVIPRIELVEVARQE